MTLEIFHGEKKKGRFTKETKFFEGEATLENITKFYEGKVITHKTILSKTAALYDPIGFAAPLKVYGSYICRRALIESAGDPLKEVGEETRKLFIDKPKVVSQRQSQKLTTWFSLKSQCPTTPTRESFKEAR